jgi:hypothetical protein
MSELCEGVKSRKPLIGDAVTIHAGLCEWDRVEGTVVDISEDPDNDMPILIQRSNFDQWPFAVHELELHSCDEVYEGGCIDPLMKVQRR